MTTVGIRELRQRARELLRRAKAGVSFEVTDRGRPVAVLAPLPDRGALARLRATGEITPSTGDMDDLAAPLPLAPWQELPSRVLVRRRRDER